MDELERFEFQVMSDVDYEDLIVEVLYEGEACFLVSQERGFENLHIAIHPQKDGKAWEFSVKVLEKVLEEAAECLWELRKITD